MSRLKNLIQILGVIGFLGWASVVFASEFTIQERYKNGERIQILIVPGHDNDFPGAKFKTDREADMALVVAEKIAIALNDDPQFVVVVGRDKNGYIPSLYEYFQSETLNVNEFIKTHAAKMKKEIQSGAIPVDKQVPHGNAAKVPMYRLYAINKWVTENNFDLVIHLHFNDEGGRSLSMPGKFSGYSVYIPDSHLLGAETSRDFGTAIALRLKKNFKPSTMSYEKIHSDKNGVISDLKLIALGSNKTTAVTRALIEYGYIYESLFSPKKFPATSKTMAVDTAEGIKDYLLGESKN